MGSRPSENTNEICQFENLSRQFLEIISATQEKADFCIDYRGLSLLLTNEPLLKVIIGLVNKGIRLRLITNLTQENISYCKLLMKYSSEVFQEDMVKGNFSILDGSKYMFYVVKIEEEKGIQGQKQIIEQVLYNEVKPFVDAQQYLFDTL